MVEGFHARCPLNNTQTFDIYYFRLNCTEAKNLIESTVWLSSYSATISDGIFRRIYLNISFSIGLSFWEYKFHLSAIKVYSNNFSSPVLLKWLLCLSLRWPSGLTPCAENRQYHRRFETRPLSSDSGVKSHVRDMVRRAVHSIPSVPLPPFLIPFDSSAHSLRSVGFLCPFPKLYLTISLFFFPQFAWFPGSASYNSSHAFLHTFLWFPPNFTSASSALSLNCLCPFHWFSPQFAWFSHSATSASSYGSLHTSQLFPLNIALVYSPFVLNCL